MISQQEILDSAIFQCIEKGLDHFGSTFKFVVYHEVKEKENIEGVMIVHKPLSFAHGLDAMFGAGSVSIKNAIVDEIASKFRITKDQEDLVSMIKKVRNGERGISF